MVDSFNTPGTEPPVIDGAPAPAPKGGLGFLSSSLAKIIAGVVAVLVVLGAIAAILMIFVLNPQPVDESIITPPPGTAAPSASVETTPTERPADDFVDTFVFRNVFQPTMKVVLPPDPLAPTDGTGSDGTNADGSDTSNLPADTLFLSSTRTVDGVPVADLVWNGTTYTLEEGQSIPDTPWQLLSISGDTVVMLFGDSRVTLTVGQGISK